MSVLGQEVVLSSANPDRGSRVLPSRRRAGALETGLKTSSRDTRDTSSLEGRGGPLGLLRRCLCTQSPPCPKLRLLLRQPCPKLLPLQLQLHLLQQDLVPLLLPDLVTQQRRGQGLVATPPVQPTPVGGSPARAPPGPLLGAGRRAVDALGSWRSSCGATWRPFSSEAEVRAVGGAGPPGGGAGPPVGGFLTADHLQSTKTI
ncbi:hypothetical protein EYF80_058158 [Liparis tanakae]|uniref:Uncharacterized protein n=1 Tax=Liparis tanakae TaxID=230148 RepID=A0A4Z2ETH9_9TELE|nr:hypothetical protein EYF80_058158 [Liparis tanakae]